MGYFSNAVFWWCSIGPQMTLNTHRHYAIAFAHLFRPYPIIYLSLQFYRFLGTFAPCHSHQHIFVRISLFCSSEICAVFTSNSYLSLLIILFHSIRFNSLCLLCSLKPRGFQWSTFYFINAFFFFFFTWLDWFLCEVTLLISLCHDLNYFFELFDIVHYKTFSNAWIFFFQLIKLLWVL